MKNLTVKLRVKQVFWYKLLFHTLLLLGKLRLISLEKAAAILNYVRRQGVFKYRVGKGKWKNLEVN